MRPWYDLGVSASLSAAAARGLAPNGVLKDRTGALLFTYALLGPLVIVPLPIGQSIGAADLLFPFALLVIATQPRIKTSAMGLWFGLFIAASILSTVLFVMRGGFPGNVGEFDTFLIIRVYALYFPLILALGWKQVTLARIKKIILGFYFSALVACGIGVLMFWAGIKVRDAQQMNWYDNGAAATLRAGGLLGNSGDFGHLSAVLGVVSVAFVGIYLKRHWLALIGVGVATYATYISSSRAAMLHLVVALLLLTPLLLDPLLRKGHRLLTLIVVGIVGLVGFAVVVPEIALSPEVQFTLRRLDILNWTGDSLFFASASRLITWDWIFQLFQSSPWLGIGYGLMVPITGRAGDNSFLSLLVETGLLSGIAFIAFWASLVWAAATARSRQGRLIAVAVVVSEIAHMLTVDTHRMWATAPVALLMVGLAIRLARAKEPPQDPDSSIPAPGGTISAAPRSRATSGRPSSRE